MKKIVSLFAFSALLFSMNVSAQQEPKQKKKKAKTEKSASTEDKKSCDKGEEKKGGCCSSKKAAEDKNLKYLYFIFKAFHRFETLFLITIVVYYIFHP